MKGITLLAPSGYSEEHIRQLAEHTRLMPFDQRVLDFLQALSESLLSSQTYRYSPELLALGYWLRRANIQRIRAKTENTVLKPVGTVVHFTPANVDTMFVYSWVCSLLVGNHNIVRLPSAELTQQQLLLGALNDVLCRSEFAPVAMRNLFVTYDKTSDISQELSLMADARVYLGGRSECKRHTRVKVQTPLQGCGLCRPLLCFAYLCQRN